MSDPHSFLHLLIYGRRDLRHWGRAFAIGSLFHLTLSDVQNEAWMVPAVMEGVGAVILLWRPMPLGFLLCLVGTAWPLLLLRDVLTQSMYLTWVAVLGVLSCARLRLDVLAAVRWVTAGTYWLAAVHKLNSDFFDPSVSCAQHAWLQVSKHWINLPLPTDPGLVLTMGIIVVELVLGILLVRRSLWLWPVGLVFHWPLTVTLAPAFAFVMFSGYAAGLTARHLVLIRSAWRRHWHICLVFVALFIGLEAFLTAKSVGLLTLVKGGLFSGLLAVIVLAASSPKRTNQRTSRFRGPVGLIFGLWIAHGLTPYFGLQYQHTAAMLSNLRIDSGCQNSWLFPDGLIGDDPYIRIDEVSIGKGLRPNREEILRDGLWSVPALATMNRNWCIPELRPIRMSGRWQGQEFLIADLCHPNWHHGLGISTLSWPGFQRFQKNLKRKCHSACIH